MNNVILTGNIEMKAAPDFLLNHEGESFHVRTTGETNFLGDGYFTTGQRVKVTGSLETFTVNKYALNSRDGYRIAAEEIQFLPPEEPDLFR